MNAHLPYTHGQQKNIIPHEVHVHLARRKNMIQKIVPANELIIIP